jgi:hypothetical protein
MFHSKLLSASLFVLIASPLGAQTIFVPPGAPIPNFQPGFNYVFPPGFQPPPGGFVAPVNVSISVGGVIQFMSVSGQAMRIDGAAQEAARAAASGGGFQGYQYPGSALPGLNLNVLDGGVTLPVDVGTPMLIQSGPSLMIGFTPPAIGGGGSAKPATSSDGNKSSESKTADKDKNTKENEKEHSTRTALFGKDTASDPAAGKDSASGGNANASPPPPSPGLGQGTPDSSKGGANDPAPRPDVASVAPPPAPGAGGGGNAVPPERKPSSDPTPPPKDPKLGEPPAPDQPKLPGDGGRVILPDGNTKPGGPRPNDPNPTARPRAVAVTPSEIRTRDPVAERIDQGLERNIGVTPPIMHQINSVGVSLPECMGASREGLACD